VEGDLALARSCAGQQNLPLNSLPWSMPPLSGLEPRRYSPDIALFFSAFGQPLSYISGRPRVEWRSSASDKWFTRVDVACRAAQILINETSLAKSVGYGFLT
jgi:hypothetical protein